MVSQVQPERARRTLYVTGFNAKYTTKRLLEELFMQGGPVVDVTLFPSHAYVLFNDEESVSYCLALFKDIELHGQKLVLHSRSKDQGRFCYVKYLMEVRNKLMSEYRMIPPPDLPAKRSPAKPKQFHHKRSKSKKKRTNPHQQQPKSQPSNHQNTKEQPKRIIRTKEQPKKMIRTKEQPKKMIKTKTIPAKQKQKKFKQNQIKKTGTKKVVRSKNKNNPRSR